jgi:two-component system, chemotaxis family, sensor kinase CheA
MIDAHKQAFIEEANELLSELESALLELESNPHNQELIAKVFRALHTIKGSSGMFGFDDITMFTHNIENVYDAIRAGKINIDKNIIDLTLAARDQIFIMLSPNNNDRIVDENITGQIVESFKSISRQFEGFEKIANISDKPVHKAVNDGVKQFKSFRIVFNPSGTIFMTGTNPLLLINELMLLGDSITLLKCNNIPSLENLDPEKCYCWWEIILKTDKEIDSIKDVFIFVEDQCELKVEQIDEENKLIKNDNFQEFKKLILETSARQEPDIIRTLMEFVPSTAKVSLNKQLKRDEKKSKPSFDNKNENESISSIRVNAEKLDELVNLVGELVTVQASLSQVAANSFMPQLTSISEEVERLTWSLRDSTLNIRMLPIGTTFSKFKRLVRDLSKELGKEVELSTEGAETELDKTVIEKLSDPLIHIIRNSIDHGIESPSERESLDKKRTGKILLSASQSGGNVLIKISDDGKGMDKDAIKSKAVRMGLISENSELSDAEIYSLIFAPGFSTAKKVTNVSGRGVGMDIVKKAIDGLRGNVKVTSIFGQGTTILLNLPLTLAIIDGLLVSIDEECFVLPLSSIEECIELTLSDIERAHGRHIINVRDKIVPYINLREKFNIKTERPDIEQIVVADINGEHIGFAVDNVLGQHQTVLKSLGKFYKNIDGVSGATILGNGTVALILDINKLVEREEVGEKMFVNHY